MQTPHLSPPLASFHELGLLSAAGLRRWLMRVPRAKGSPSAAIEQGHARWIAAISRSASRLVVELGREPSFACRQALATSPRESLAAWRHVLAFGALDPFGDCDSVSTLISAAESRWPSRRAQEQEWFAVLSSASSRSLAELSDAVRASWPLWLAVIGGAPAPAARKELLRFLTAQSSEIYGRGSYETTRIDRVSTSVTTLLLRRPDIRLSVREYDTVPPRFIAQLKDPSIFLTPAVAASIKRRNARHEADAAANAIRLKEREARAKATAEAKLQRAIVRERQVVEAACSAILDLAKAVGSDRRESRRRWQAVARRLRAISRLQDGGSRAGARDRLAATVASFRDTFHLIEPATPGVQSQIAGKLSSTAPEWLRFLSMSRRAQCMAGLPEGESEAGGPKLSVPPALRTTVTESAVRFYLRHRSDRSRIWANMGGSADAESQRLWDAAFLVRRTIAQTETNDVLEWLGTTSAQARDQFERTHGRWLGRVVQDPEAVRRLVDDEARHGAITVLGLRCCRRFALAMSAATGIKDQKSRVATLRGLRKLRAKLDDHGRSIADQIASEGLQALDAESAIELLGNDLNDQRLLMLVESAAEPTVSVRRAAGLHRYIGSGRTRGLRARFARAMQDPGVSARAVDGAWRSAIACGQDEALRLASEHPERFVARAAKELPHANLLARAVVKPSFASHVGIALGSDASVAALPAARLLLSGRPGLRAVLELAVLADLREVAHLRQLARTCRDARSGKPGHRLDSRYRTYELPKRSGGKRMIAVPGAALMRLQRRLLVGALNPVPLHDAAHGFRRGRSILTNATAHVGKRLVVNVDIKGFFPSTLYSSVLAACLKVDGGSISVRGAKLLADICCYRGALPTGAPTSPAIGNIVLRRADAAIAAAAAKHGITYTRYADDLTFSGDGDCKRILPFVARVLQDCGYELDGKKTQLYRRGRQQLVTNLVVNDKAHLRRSDRRRLRAAVEHRCAGDPVTWHGRPMDDQALCGRIALLRMIEPATAQSYMVRLRNEATGWGSARG
jgi:hypothetical protein